MVAAAPKGETTARLVQLREEIAIFPAPPALDGSPAWTLHDPARNRFYRLRWPGVEIISRWGSGTADVLIDRIASETTLQIEPEDVEALGRFLLAFDLLRVDGPQATARLLQK